MKTLCIYHANCTDGFTAAWAVRRALGDEVEFHPGVYGEAPPDVTGRNVVLVDFSYKRAVLNEMAAKAHSVLVLDHHKSAQEDLAGFQEPPEDWEAWKYAISHENPLGFPAVRFDMLRSGAGITWDFFFPEDERPELLDFVEDRDLWLFKLPATRFACAALFSYDQTFENWDAIFDYPVENIIDDGKALERNHLKLVKDSVRFARKMEIGGHTVPVLNTIPSLTSDCGHELAKGNPFSACYVDVQNSRQFSLRSTDEGLDVSEIAKMYGGGGHRNAAGFKVSRDHKLARE